jgi:CubicO group peptidase (beta-lactamase class C family)
LQMCKARVLLLVALVLLTSSPFVSPAPTDAQSPDLDAFVEQALRDYEVPGAAVAVVHQGQTVLLRGYGVRRLGEPGGVDPETVFQLASVSKSVTATGMAALVDEGKLAWDEPAISYLPELVLHDPYPTRYVTARDFLAHRSGLPAFGGDLLGRLGYDRAEVLRRVRYIEPEHSFREEAGYSNVGFFIAGEVAARANGSSWEQVITSKVFAPLGMRRSGTSSHDRPADGNWAANHAGVDGQLQEIPWEGVDVLGAAGSIVSTAADMVPYMRMLLAKGELDGRRILADLTVESLFQPSMVSEVGFAELPPISEQTGFSYGLGWGVYYYQGSRVIEKGGALGGVRTVVTLVPEKQLGVTVLANRNFTALPEAIRAWVLERYVGPSGRDPQREIRERQGRLEALVHPPMPPADPGPTSLDLDGYTGTYTSELYGQFTVVRDGGGLRVEAGPGGYPGKLPHWSRDTFALTWAPVTFLPEPITFTVGPDGYALQFTSEALGRFIRECFGDCRRPGAPGG